MQRKKHGKMKCCVSSPAMGCFECHFLVETSSLVFHIFFPSKRRKEGKTTNASKVWNRDLPLLRCYSYMLVDTLKLVDHFLCVSHFCNIFLLFLSFLMGKSESTEKMISTSKQHAKHGFSIWNTQQWGFIFEWEQCKKTHIC